MWKCLISGCRDGHYGWPTQKERDRHVKEKHNYVRPVYKCQFAGCSYESQRESNCKQHMEKAHGQVYAVRRSMQSKARAIQIIDTSTKSVPNEGMYGWSEVTLPQTRQHIATGAQPHAYDDGLNCLLQTCPFKATYEDQLKQHMEGAHDWVHVKENPRNDLYDPRDRMQGSPPNMQSDEDEPDSIAG